jgi:hypothetical protein
VQWCLPAAAIAARPASRSPSTDGGSWPWPPAEAGVAKGVLHRHFADFDAFLAKFALDRVAGIGELAGGLRARAGTGTVAGNLAAAVGRVVVTVLAAAS